ncbi:hypothetical protein M8C13_36430 [Crossiella sp. SN42]|uniref:hypothetical protein n=1 Tax=Crossiella sp. SN42 TaxID=2944808 RepID=UPI00207D3800|nr:hypothetical protein [Crossiella sp. SN42]MCO1581252.1 hypothetical protein [Crossiella sp. SN42]
MRPVEELLGAAGFGTVLGNSLLVTTSTALGTMVSCALFSFIRAWNYFFTQSLVPILLFFLAFQRFLVQGVATSGLKG